jgi:hypothetical protein
MKRYIILFVVLAILMVVLPSCGNVDLWDTNYQFDRAIIGFPDGTTKTITVKQWTDYADGEQIQIIADDGTIYLVSSYNCILINDPD